MAYSPSRTGTPAVDRNLDAIATAVNAPFQRPSWTLVPSQLVSGVTTYLNSWVYAPSNYPPDPGSTNGHPPPGYLKDAFGFVTLRGAISGGTVAADATGTVFNLPAGCRPLYEVQIAVDANGAFGFVSVIDNGDVRVPVGSNSYVSLDGVRFLAEQ